ncbi:MAG: MlaE family ABC transporter permease [Oligosphaeraceae bacterium]
MAQPQAIFQEGRLQLSGCWRQGAPRPAPEETLQGVPREQTATLPLQADALEEWDTSLLIFLDALQSLAQARGLALDTSTLPDGLQTLLKLQEQGRQNQPREADAPRPLPFLARWGTATLETARLFLDLLQFLGELLMALGRLFTGRSTMRLEDLRRQLCACGPGALPIIALISFLMGLVLAFVGSIPLKWFQAQPYVASLVGIGMLRLMSPVMVGIVMAGRTSAAYAAELGTMKTNEELDAFQTQGISLMDFLVMPRFLAMSLMLPLLCLFADVVSILGGMLVAILDLGLTANAYWNTLVTTTRTNDLVVGVFTCAVLGLLDALCGCYQGIRCGRNAAAVGRATTASVVYSIVCIVIATSLITVITVVLKY